MKTIEIILYKFEELSEEVQQKVLEDNCYINVDHNWWEYIYDDAKQVDLEIEGFDIDRGSYCNLVFRYEATDTAEAILENRGSNCDTYKLAKEFMNDRDALVEKYSDGISKDIVAEDNEYDFDNECDDIEEEFRKSLSEEYLTMLRDEYEYRTSKEYIKDCLVENDYDFTEDGEIY